MIAEKKIKYTKKNEAMAFLTLEDLVGSVEVIVFPKMYRQHINQLVEDNKILVKGRVSAEEEKDGKLICEDIIAFSSLTRTLWLQFASEEEWKAKEPEISDWLNASDGHDHVKLFFADTKKVTALPPNRSVDAGEELNNRLSELIGQDNVRIVY